MATSDGKVFNGLLRGENADELILATGVNQETRVARGYRRIAPQYRFGDAGGT